MYLFQELKELFYRREIELFWDAKKPGDTYGIRVVLRSPFSITANGLGWRRYSDRTGNTISMTTKQMDMLLKQAETFVRDRTKVI